MSNTIVRPELVLALQPALHDVEVCPKLDDVPFDRAAQQFIDLFLRLGFQTYRPLSYYLSALSAVVEVMEESEFTGEGQ